MGKCKGALLEILKLGGSEPVSEEVFENRIEQCNNCKFKKDEGKEIQCKLCGCCMYAKAMFTFHLLEDLGRTKIDCPKGFWKE